jgi:hypothetical protein
MKRFYAAGTGVLRLDFSAGFGCDSNLLLYSYGFFVGVVSLGAVGSGYGYFSCYLGGTYLEVPEEIG